MTIKLRELGLGNKILLCCGLFWILGGGCVALYVALLQLGDGKILSSIGSGVVAVIAYFVAWLMVRDFTQR